MIVGIIASMLLALVRVKKARASFDETQSKRAAALRFWQNQLGMNNCRKTAIKE